MTNTTTDKTLSIIILAAGTSSRLGTSKQLLLYKNESLLQIAVKKALSISSNVFVVLGAQHDACLDELKSYDVQTIDNKNYTQGMGTSLSFGIKHTKEFEYTLVMLCDQPFLPKEHLEKLVEFKNFDKIVTTFCENKPMVPAIFPKKHYPTLLELDGDKGARDLLKQEDIFKVDLKKEFLIDIDTKEDIEKYLS